MPVCFVNAGNAKQPSEAVAPRAEGEGPPKPGGPSLSGKYFREELVLDGKERLPPYAGNTRRTVVPSPSVLFRETLALWKAAPCFTIESPRPVPPISLEWLLSTR